MTLVAAGQSWADDVQVDERRLQEYLHKKKHGMLLKGAALAMKHTLEPLPTTNASDGKVHMGDSLMLRNAATGGLLQADVTDTIQVDDNSRAAASGFALSTGTLLTSCARNVLTVSRVDDGDGFPEDGFLHYGQTFRLGAGPQLNDRPAYLYSCGTYADGQHLARNETLSCLYSRATPGTHWRCVRLQAVGLGDGGDDVVRLGWPLRIESAPHGGALGSDATLRMTHYGNECRVFSAGPAQVAASSEENHVAQTAWSFVDSQWADEVIAAAQRVVGDANFSLEYDPDDGPSVRDARTYLAGLDIPKGWGHIDPRELLTNADKRGEHFLTVMDLDPTSSACKTLHRIFPLIRNAGMHKTRKLRQMCMQADTHDSGTIAIRSFAGVLSWIAIRLKQEEMDILLELLRVDPHSDHVDYRRFFSLMAPPMAEIRGDVVRDAYAKLRAGAPGGLVEAADLQRHWRPRCHPEVQRGILSEGEAMDEFLRQWDIADADGRVSWEEFLDYYQDISMAVEQTEVFVEIVRHGWSL